MIIFKKGDILYEEADALVNTVNCVGVMGRGVALQFKQAFPDNFQAYAKACANGTVKPGRMFVYETGRLQPRYIINFPTKRHWRGKSRMEDIKAGLGALVTEIKQRGISSIAIPPLGSGLGGLDWPLVRQFMEAELGGLDELAVTIFEPNDSLTEGTLVPSQQFPQMTPGRAALVGLIHNHLAGMLDPYLSLLELHKLLYFLQAAGQPLKLRFSKAPYGPYAENLRHVLMKIEGHFISGYTPGDSPHQKLELKPEALQQALNYLAQDQKTSQRFHRVTDLIQGFESPWGLELLATVHWVVQKESGKSLDDIVAKTYAWNQRKSEIFSVRQIEIALDILIKKGWLEALTTGSCD